MNDLGLIFNPIYFTRSEEVTARHLFLFIFIFFAVLLSFAKISVLSTMETVIEIS